jgi:hypothetical protein
MLNAVRRHLATAVIAGLTSLAVLGAAPVAAAAYDAMNAQKVDGLSAVPFRTSRLDRATKLVATDLNGHLPNNIIVKARNADKLDNIDSTQFQRTLSNSCTIGQAISAIDAAGHVSCVTIPVPAPTTRVLREASTAASTANGDWPMDMQFTQRAGETLVSVAGRVTITAPGGCSNQYSVLTVYLDGTPLTSIYVGWESISLNETKSFDLGSASRIAPAADNARTITATVVDGCDNDDYTYDNLKLDLVLAS